MKLLIYVCPEIPHMFEVQLHDDHHNVVGTQLINRDWLLRLLNDRQPIILDMELWEDIKLKKDKT